MNNRKLKRILDRHEMRTNANRAYSLSMQRRIGKLEESLKALTLRVDSLHVEQAREGLEEEIDRVAEKPNNNVTVGSIKWTFAEPYTGTIPPGAEPTLPEAVDDHKERLAALEGKEQALFQTLNTACAKVLACEQDIKKLFGARDDINNRANQRNGCVNRDILDLQRRLADLENAVQGRPAEVIDGYTDEPSIGELRQKVKSLETACNKPKWELQFDQMVKFLNLDKRLAAIEESISALQHAACETAREVLEVNDHYRHDQTLPPGEIHLEQDGVTYIHRPDEVIGVDMAKSGCETIITDI